MKKILQILTLILVSTQVSGQINSENLNGEWTVNNHDSSYYKTDTILLVQDINYQYELKTCDIIIWKKEEKEFEVQYVNICSEPGRVTKYNEHETIDLSRKNGNQTLLIKRNGKTLDYFQVLDYIEKRIERYPYDIKILKLKRIKTAGNTGE